MLFGSRILLGRTWEIQCNFAVVFCRRMADPSLSKFQRHQKLGVIFVSQKIGTCLWAGVGGVVVAEGLSLPGVALWAEQPVSTMLCRQK